MADQELELDIETGEEVKPQPEVENKEEHEEHEERDEREEQDERDERDTGSDDGEEGDEEGTEDEREAIRARRREERKHRKQAQKEREDSLRRELQARDAIINEMRQRLDVVERRSTGSEQAQLENAKKQAAQAYNFFKDQIRVATEANNGAAVADATEKMILAQRKFDELTAYENAYKRQQAAPQPLDPRLANQAQEWMKRNSWYDPTARDQDSRIVMMLDQNLGQEGWDPTTPEYWSELDNRVKKYLPHRANQGKMTNTKPKSVVAGSGRESASSSSKVSSTYRLSAERVQALKEAGLWDDPKKRAEAVKRFRDYDKQHSGE